MLGLSFSLGAAKSFLKSKDLEWYFFCPRDLKYATGSRTKRATDLGYWKTTGRDKAIVNKSDTVGMRKTLVFHEGKAPGGSRTDWVIYEYRLKDKDLTDTGNLQVMILFLLFIFFLFIYLGVILLMDLNDAFTLLKCGVLDAICTCGFYETSEM